MFLPSHFEICVLIDLEFFGISLLQYAHVPVGFHFFHKLPNSF
ncbi:hypothetical protein LEP1GSC008_3532 [Leptospira kirschneri serovar Bulgarica str. Nikolaevo]|uniref:Uncharacterized protein n=1 Tax=Leptospira kirschneri serovar Bulgarica str. Nikolaevo TaxID=1240687 RepID=M6FJ33_9LEPT|nr:hypothetical protein LEP1GSC008_3532 [Leptospira kirschneri serovar Bulgarica str. Nikolaevo]